MKKLIVLLFLFPLLFLNGSGQVLPSNSTVLDLNGEAHHEFAGADVSAWFVVGGTGFTNHRINWVPFGSPATATCKLEQSVDGVTPTDLVAETSCTSAGISAITEASTNFVRLRVTALTGAGARVRLYYKGLTTTAGTTVDSELPAAAALADNMANPTPPPVGAFALVWDGATWDRWTGAVTGTITANAGTGTFTVGDGSGALNVIIDSGTTAVTGPMTNTEARASPLPVSLPTTQVGIDCTSTVVYDASTNGNTELVSLTASQTIYVCGFYITTAATSAVGVRLVYGTGTACATGETSLTPLTTYQNSAGITPTGLVVPVNGHTGLKTAVSNALCIETNAAQAVQALVWYLKQ